MTNIAEALRRDPSIVENIEVVQIMGGAVFTEGKFTRTSRSAFFPLIPSPSLISGSTPVAAQEVFDAGEQGLKNSAYSPRCYQRLSNSIAKTIKAWLDTGTPESTIAAELLDYALTVIQSDNDPNPVWDLVAAINLAEPEFSPETPLHIDVDTASDPGDTQGQNRGGGRSPA